MMKNLNEQQLQSTFSENILDDILQGIGAYEYHQEEWKNQDEESADENSDCYSNMILNSINQQETPADKASVILDLILARNPNIERIYDTLDAFRLHSMIDKIYLHGAELFKYTKTPMLVENYDITLGSMHLCHKSYNTLFCKQYSKLTAAEINEYAQFIPQSQYGFLNKLPNATARIMAHNAVYKRNNEIGMTFATLNLEYNIFNVAMMSYSLLNISTNKKKFITMSLDLILTASWVERVDKFLDKKLYKEACDKDLIKEAKNLNSSIPYAIAKIIYPVTSKISPVLNAIPVPVIKLCSIASRCNAALNIYRNLRCFRFSLNPLNMLKFMMHMPFVVLSSISLVRSGIDIYNYAHSYGHSKISRSENHR